MCSTIISLNRFVPIKDCLAIYHQHTHHQSRWQHEATTLMHCRQPPLPLLVLAQHHVLHPVAVAAATLPLVVDDSAKARIACMYAKPLAQRALQPQAALCHREHGSNPTLIEAAPTTGRLKGIRTNVFGSSNVVRYLEANQVNSLQ